MKPQLTPLNTSKELSSAFSALEDLERKLSFKHRETILAENFNERERAINTESEILKNAYNELKEKISSSKISTYISPAPSYQYANLLVTIEINNISYKISITQDNSEVLANIIFTEKRLLDQRANVNKKTLFKLIPDFNKDDNYLWEEKVYKNKYTTMSLFNFYAEELFKSVTEHQEF